MSKRNFLKIVVINHEFPPYGGGGAVYTETLVNSLAKNNLVYLITIQKDNEEPVVKTGNLVKVSIPVKRKSIKQINSFAAFLFTIRAAFFLEEFLDSNDIDIVHAQFSLIAGLSARLIYNVLKRKNVKFVVTCLGADIYEPTRFKGLRFFFKLINKSVLKKASLITVPSEDMKERILKLNKNLNVKKVHLGINTVKFIKLDKETVRNQLNLSNNDFILITVCRLVKRKNLIDTLKVFKEVKKSIDNVKLIIVGEGPEKKRIETFINRNNLTNDVILTGEVNVNMLNAYYSASDIFYTNSFHESFGLVYIESMASGCPVLSSYNGGAQEIVIDGFNGFLLRNIKDFVDKIILLFNNRKKLLEITYNSLKITDNFDYNIMVNNFLQCYKSLCE